MISASTIALSASSARGGLVIKFDYSYDTHGFFTPERQALLEIAADNVNRYLDDLKAIEPTDNRYWAVRILHPEGDANPMLLNLEIPEDTVRIYVGSQAEISGSTVAESSPGVFSAFGSGLSPAELAAWEATVNYRGETAAAGNPALDFGPWGGTISFDRSTNWYFDQSSAGLGSTQVDFLSIAMHEVGHLLGVGPAPSWRDYTNTAVLPAAFLGPESTAVVADLRLTTDLGHWASGTTSDVNGTSQLAIMGPTFSPGERRYFTSLDRAVLRDIGWQEAVAGDADLDGALTGSDVNRLVAAGFVGSPILGTWSTGDWDGDGYTTGSDINLLIASGFDGSPIIYTASQGQGNLGEPGNPSIASLVGADSGSSEAVLPELPVFAVKLDSAVMGTAGDGMPDLIVDPSTGQVILDTDGQILNGVQIQSRGLNRVISALGDGDSFLLGGLTPLQIESSSGLYLNAFVFNSSSEDEYFGGVSQLGGLPAGLYDLGMLIDPQVLQAQQDVAAFLLSDLRFGFNGDTSAAGNGFVRVVPEPGTLTLMLLGMAALTVYWRRRRATG